MSLQFSRSLRSLRTDSFRMARIGLVLAMVAVIALILWFFFARVTLFENSNDIQLTDGGRILAAFPEGSIDRIRSGQGVILRLQSDSDDISSTLPAVVFSVDRSSNQAEILLVSEGIPPDISPGALKGQVSVEVAYVTPISLVLRATGNGAAAREIQMSPRSAEGTKP